jgi:hypothetical protein
MTHTKRQKVQKPHSIYQTVSEKGHLTTEGANNPGKFTDHYIYLTRHLNPHSVFRARTTLSQGRGK